MVKFRVVLIILTYILSAGAMFGADRLQLVSLKDDMLPEPQVTAEAVFVGLVRPKVTTVQGTSSETILAALPPENRTNGVCVRVTTADGLYSGVAEYKSAGADTSNMTLMDYVSDEEALATYSENEIAVLVFPCDSALALSTAAVATWRSDDVVELGESVNVLVNSFRADAAFLIVNDTEQVDCQPYKVGERAALSRDTAHESQRHCRWAILGKASGGRSPTGAFPKISRGFYPCVWRRQRSGFSNL